MTPIDRSKGLGNCPTPLFFLCRQEAGKLRLSLEAPCHMAWFGCLPKLGGTSLGVPIKNIVCCGLYCGKLYRVLGLGFWGLGFRA